jgi:hypothetical protein
MRQCFFITYETPLMTVVTFAVASAGGGDQVQVHSGIRDRFDISTVASTTTNMHTILASKLKTNTRCILSSNAKDCPNKTALNDF